MLELVAIIVLLSSPGSPAKLVGCYWTRWGDPIRVKDVPLVCNAIYLFAAVPVGGTPGATGAVEWIPPANGRGAGTELVADIAFARAHQGRRVFLSVGGGGNALSLSTRERARVFVDSVKAIHIQLGGFDGIDWNTYEGGDTPDSEEMIWASLELKRIYGSDFAITTPPAPWSEVDKALCKAMLDAGALSYASPQYYDGPGLADQNHIKDDIKGWIGLLGASRVAVGFGINSGSQNFQTTSQVARTWQAISNEYPRVKGAYIWSISTDEANGWGFVTEVAPRVLGAARTPA